MFKYTATAKNEPASSLLKCIKLSAAIRIKYAELSKRRLQSKSIHEKVITQPLSLTDQFQDHTKSWALLLHLTGQRCLLNCITKAGPFNKVPDPHVSTPPPHVQPDLLGLHFHKSKILKRVQEVMPLIEATNARLWLIFDQLLKEEKYAKTSD